MGPHVRKGTSLKLMRRDFPLNFIFDLFPFASLSTKGATFVLNCMQRRSTNDRFISLHPDGTWKLCSLTFFLWEKVRLLRVLRTWKFGDSRVLAFVREGMSRVKPSQFTVSGQFTMREMIAWCSSSLSRSSSSRSLVWSAFTSRRRGRRRWFYRGKALVAIPYAK